MLGAPARAQAAEVEIAWEAPRGCPQESAIRAAVRRWLDLSPEVLDAGQVSIDGRIERVGQDFVLDLALESLSGRSREALRAEQCHTLADATALKVMLAATPPNGDETAEALSRRAHVRATRDLRAAVRRVDGSASDADAVSASRRTALALRLEFQGGLAVGLLPDAAPDIGSMLALELRHWRLSLGIRYHTPVGVGSQGLPGQDASVQLLGGAFRTCPVARMGLELGVCVSVEIGRTMRGIGETTSYDAAWGALGLGPSVRVPVARRVWLAVDLQGLRLFSGDRLLHPFDWAVHGAAGVGLQL